MPLSYRTRLATPLPRADVRSRVEARLTAIGGRPALLDDDRLRFSFGSSTMTRLLGGVLLGPESLPVDLQVTLTPAPTGGTLIDLDATDTMGVGLRVGLSAKYRQRFAQLAAAVADVLGQPVPEPLPDADPATG